MSQDALDGAGLRLRMEVNGERFYLTATRNTVDDGIDYMATVPDENKPTVLRLRMAIEAICAACSDLSRRV